MWRAMCPAFSLNAHEGLESSAVAMLKLKQCSNDAPLLLYRRHMRDLLGLFLLAITNQCRIGALTELHGRAPMQQWSVACISDAGWTTNMPDNIQHRVRRFRAQCPLIGSRSQTLFLLRLLGSSRQLGAIVMSSPVCHWVRMRPQ